MFFKLFLCRCEFDGRVNQQQLQFVQPGDFGRQRGKRVGVQPELNQLLQVTDFRRQVVKLVEAEIQICQLAQLKQSGRQVGQPATRDI